MIARYPSVWFLVPFVALIAAVVCAAILGALLKSGLAWRLAMDIPNDRSLHSRPTPRIGGWGVMPVVLTALVIFLPALWALTVAVAFLAVVSQIDDRRGLSVRVRFSAHVAAATAIAAVYGTGLPWWWLAVLLLAIIWSTNLYNFMDGADGLAGGMTFFGFTGYAIIALAGPHPQPSLGFVSIAAAGAAAGFLRFNFHPARVFLGDAGSIPLGLLAAAFGFWGWRQGVWPVWFAPVVFGPFICDASVTLLRRLWRGERFWTAHREHYYQRMVRSGLGHAQTARILYGLMLSGMLIAAFATFQSQIIQWVIVAGWLVLLCIAGVGIDLRWRRFQANEILRTKRGC